jgi:MFS transporter, LPLT family, lysophospholipid transporter
MSASPTSAASENPLFSRGMTAVLIAQFISAFADNALLFAAIAVLKSQMAEEWQIPLLQEFFVIAFIILAPFVGPFADTLSKGRVMLIANGLKFTGAAAMLAGLQPLIAYSMVGIGAAAYSPAKYGILSELVSPDKLVKANSMIEGSTIVAILLGAIVGGLLADYSIMGALSAITISYLLAMVANLFIPHLPPAHPLNHFSPRILIKDFMLALGTLFKDKDARFCLLGTGVFWGAGATLRFLLVAWVPVALLMTDLSTAANLSGAVAIGIAFGAFGAAKLVTLQSIHRALPAGILIGALITAFATIDHLYVAIAMLILIGACGGFYVVPLNALLQDRGHATVGSGHAIAVKNFFDNLCMLLMLGIYSLMDKSGIGIITSTILIGLLVTTLISLLAYFRLKGSSAH